MYTTPHLERGAPLDVLMPSDGQLAGFLGELGVEFSPDGDVLGQASQVARTVLIEETSNGGDPLKKLFLDEVPARDMLVEHGFIDEIQPPQADYDHIMVDGAMADAFAYRMTELDRWLRDGTLHTGDITAYAGQRLRHPNDDRKKSQEARAQELLSQDIDPYFTGWIKEELDKDPNATSPWDRPFATEHETATLVLVNQYGAELEYDGVEVRPEAHDKVEGIPSTDVRARRFAVAERLAIRLLNAPAIIREMDGHVLGPEHARPTTVSCFREFLDSAVPQHGADIGFFSHNPHIFRTWLDVVIDAYAKQGRTDLRIDGMGASVQKEVRYGVVLGSLGRMITGLNAQRGYIQQQELAEQATN